MHGPSDASRKVAGIFPVGVFGRKKGFTLIELLVVIAIIAILAVVVVLTLNPAQLLAQARDSSRISDFATLKSVLAIYTEDVTTTTPMYGPGGAAADTLYTAMSGATTTTSTYTGSAAGAWGFSTSTNSYASPITINTSRAVNGTGWIPVALTAISSGAPIASLPVDPANKNGLQYIYGATTTAYKLATQMESAKYKSGGPSDVETNDGGNNTGTYEQGSNLSL